MQKALLTLLAATFIALAGCATNAVTGARNFQVVGSDWEQQVGSQMYAPMKQSQGGDFILDPELTAYVQEVGNRLAERARRRDELDFEFSVLNDSVPNAWALPGGKIVVNRGLLTELDSEAELAAVLGHEIVHADAAHGARAQSKGMLVQLGAVATMVVLGSTLDNPTAREMGMMVPALGAQLLTQKYGRDAERESDKYGMLYMSEAGYDPQGAVELQQTFLQLSEGRDADWLTGLFASHPPSQERLDNNRRAAKKLPPGGETGRERYQQKMAYLRRVQPAYDAFEEANKAVNEEQLPLAQEKLNQALSLEPRESLFHALQGDIHALNDKPKTAIKSYSRAIEANENLFYGFLRRGQLTYKLEQGEAARPDLEHSLELMPTAEAHFLLGMLDKQAKQIESALQHFLAAAQSDSEAGQRATVEYVRLDAPQNPARYIGTRVAVDDANAVWAVIGNLTPVPLSDIEVSYAWLDDQGQTRQGRVAYPGPLAGGAQDKLPLNIRLADVRDLNQRVRVEIIAARVPE
jgi:predicted Zn-dependent protease